MISDRHCCIFVHIPKCGGSSLEAVLWPGTRSEADLWMGFVDEFHNRYQTGGLQHLHAEQIKTEVGATRFASYFKFALVRNPFDRAVSQFAYMSTRPDLRSFVGMEEHDSFPRYLDLIAERMHVQWEPQNRFLTGEDGSCLVDFVGRFERFEADTATVLGRLGLSGLNIPHHNQSKRGPYRSYYRDADRKKVEQLYAEDLEMFGYTF
jgi:hypothetical protein